MFIFLVFCGKTLVRWPRMCDSLLSAVEAAAAADVFSSSIFLTHQSSIRKRKERRKRYYGKRRGVFSKGYTHIPIRHIGCYKKRSGKRKEKNLFVCLCLSCLFGGEIWRFAPLLSPFRGGVRETDCRRRRRIFTVDSVVLRGKERGNAPARRRVETARRKICQEGKRNTKKIVCRIHFKAIFPFFVSGINEQPRISFLLSRKKVKNYSAKKVESRQEGRKAAIIRIRPNVDAILTAAKKEKSGKTEVGDFL